MVALPELDFLLKVLHDFAARRGMNKIRCIVYIVITKNLSQPQKDSNTKKKEAKSRPQTHFNCKKIPYFDKSAESPTGVSALTNFRKLCKLILGPKIFVLCVRGASKCLFFLSFF